MIVIGASGHAKVVLGIMEALDIAVTLVYDKDVAKKKIKSYSITHEEVFSNHETAVIAVGNNKVRSRLAKQYKGKFTVAIIHPSAIVDPSATIGEGSVVMPGAIVNADAQIGKHCIINSGAVIEHDCVIGDFAHISPKAVLAGNVTIGAGVQVGLNASVIQGKSIGKDAIIGAGAVVVHNIPSRCTAIGVPAKPIKFHDSATI
ncbi:acetyltransferase [Dokdonia sinensis]|uniref:Acetyltransferase n=1 Tax=Dokdonia sinensis TaxID=2479847 RepID=A0A3M0GGL7_9FLAO|nr:acetyltransferase [Dokdonia sinensis]RMB63830.1 acetyltransferase [Dokdonia sinensis]